MKKKIFSLLVLLAAAVSGAWAQDADNCPNAGRLQKRVAKAPRRVAANIPSEVTLSFSCTSGYQYGVASDGEYIYVSSWSGSSSSMFYKYGLDGSFIEEFNISNCGNFRDMTYDGTYFYGVANGSTIYQIDFKNKTVVGTINIEGMTMRCITYDKKRDGFWVTGNWSGPLALYDRNGNKIQEGIYAGSVSGLGYYEDYTGEEHIIQLRNGYETVSDYNITTNTLHDNVFNLTTMPGYSNGTTGGCFIGEYEGQICLFADMQQSPNIIGIYPLSDTKKIFDLTKDADAEAHGDIQFNVGEGEYVKEDVTKAKEGNLVTVVITPADGWAVNKPTGLWYANEAAARSLRRVAASPENLDMLKDFDLQFVSEDPETRAQTWTFEMKRANAEISCTYKKLLTNTDITVQDITALTYTGKPLEPAIVVKDGETTLEKDVDYTVSYSNNVNAAASDATENAPTVTITAVATSEKYAGETTKTFTINPATITDEMIGEIDDQTFTTNPIEPDLTITFGEGDDAITLTKGTDFTVEYSNNVNVGEATATATGQGNFTGEASANFDIIAKALADDMIGPIDDQDYTGEPYEPDLDVEFNGKKLQEGVDYTVEYADNVEAGKATATITGIGNYEGEASANFYVGRCDLNDDTRIKIAYIYWEDYDGAKHTPRVEVRDGMKPLVLDVDYKMTFKDNVEAGTARITFQGLGNYKGKVNKYFAIKSYVLDIDMVQDIADQTWTGEAVTPAISVINGNVTLTQDKDFTVKFKNNVNEGTATAIINGTGNFRSIDLVKTFKIVKKAEVTDPEAVEAPGEATAINETNMANEANGTAYDLQGRKVVGNRKGVVIIDGKLVLKK